MSSMEYCESCSKSSKIYSLLSETPENQRDNTLGDRPLLGFQGFTASDGKVSAPHSEVIFPRGKPEASQLTRQALMRMRSTNYKRQIVAMMMNENTFDEGPIVLTEMYAAILSLSKKSSQDLQALHSIYLSEFNRKYHPEYFKLEQEGLILENQLNEVTEKLTELVELDEEFKGQEIDFLELFHQLEALSILDETRTDLIKQIEEEKQSIRQHREDVALARKLNLEVKKAQIILDYEKKNIDGDRFESFRNFFNMDGILGGAKAYAEAKDYFKMEEEGEQGKKLVSGQDYAAGAAAMKQKDKLLEKISSKSKRRIKVTKKSEQQGNAKSGTETPDNPRGISVQLAIHGAEGGALASSSAQNLYGKKRIKLLEGGLVASDASSGGEREGDSTKVHRSTAEDSTSRIFSNFLGGTPTFSFGNGTVTNPANAAQKKLAKKIGKGMNESLLDARVDENYLMQSMGGENFIGSDFANKKRVEKSNNRSQNTSLTKNDGDEDGISSVKGGSDDRRENNADLAEPTNDSTAGEKPANLSRRKKNTGGKKKKK